MAKRRIVEVRMERQNEGNIGCRASRWIWERGQQGVNEAVVERVI
jgi:hypothetical protein